jgi:4-amino-4-deoxy-L-arabinose transferase-like glycosyltransferase
VKESPPDRKTTAPTNGAPLDAAPPPPAPPRPVAARPWQHRAGTWVGVLLLALYLTVLARNDLDAAMGRGDLPALPGGWKAVAAILGLAVLAVAAVGARQAGWRWSGAGVRRWALAHAAPLFLGAITLGALALRVYGISDNLPYINHPDEPAVADRALHILQSGDFNPHYFVYPNLYTYLEAAVFLVRFFVLVSAGTISTLAEIVPTDFYLWGRLLTALLGTLTVPLVYLAGRRLYGLTVGLVAAAFMATNSVHILNSQLITTDAPSAFFSALALAAIVWLVPRGEGGPSEQGGERPALASLGRYLLAGAAVGLAMGTKYNSALVILPFLVAHGYGVAALPGDRLRAFFGVRLWVGLGATAVAFLLTTPFILFDLPNFLDELASVVAHYRYGHTGHESDTNWIFYVSSFLGSDFWPTLLTLGGVIFAVLRHRRADVLMLVFPLVFYFSMSNYRVNFEHNLLPILPFTSVLAALALVIGWRAATRQLVQVPRFRDRVLLGGLAQGVLAVLVAGAISGPAIASAQRDYLHAQLDNRFRAQRWLDANTRPGTKVWLEDGGPTLPASRYLLGHGAHVTEHPLDWYVANRFDYVVLSATAYKDVVYDHPNSNPALRDAYLAFFQANESRLVAAFERNEVDAPGPSIRIYRTGYAPPASAAAVQAQHPLAAGFRETAPNGGTIRLVGADFPAEAAKGSALPLTLYWVAETPVGDNYTVFIHLIDANGARPTQRDLGPRSGTYPTAQWAAGEVVVDEAPLALPATLAPGTYTLHIGLYAQKADNFLPPLPLSGAPPGSGPDYVTLGPITIK